MILLDEVATAVVSQPIIALRGKVSNQSTDSISVTNETSGSCIQWPVITNRFKVFVILKPGSNKVSFKYEYYTKEVTYVFCLKQSPYIVQPLYIVSRDGEGHFQAPPGVDNSCTAALKRISLGVALLQTFTAENLKAHHSRHSYTFQLPLNSTNGLPKCMVFKSTYTAKEMYAMSSKDLWRSLAQEIMDSDEIPRKCESKFLAFLSCTKYNGENWSDKWKYRDVVMATDGHIALGGGGLAVLGSGTLHTWAANLEDLVSCFTDETIIDYTKLMDDSAYRGTYWANYATGIGAALHELGHTFDLVHTKTGIMSRGFDNIHQFFVLPGAKPVLQSCDKQVDKFHLMRCKFSRLREELEKQRKELLTRKQTRVASVEAVSLVPTITITAQTVVTSSSTSTESQPSSTDLQTKSPAGALLYPDKQLYYPTESTQRVPEVSTNPAEAANFTSTWAPESAVMLRYSRWLMKDDEIQMVDVMGKPTIVIQQGCIYSTHELRAVQVYYKCVDYIVFSHHFAVQDSNNPCRCPRSIKLSDIMAMQQHCQQEMTHSGNCDRINCIFIHIRDASGNFQSHQY